MTEKKKQTSRGRKGGFGRFLANLRETKGMTLREVEEATNHEVSNGYLSQLENGKITKPSPNILYNLASAYGLAYELLMEKAGYLAATSTISDGAKHGRVATFADKNLTAEEEEELLEYLAFLRTRRKRK